MADRLVRCRMTNKTGDRCTAEALDPEGEILICMEHTARVLELLAAKGASVPLLLGSAGEARLLREIRDGVAEARTMVQGIAEVPR